MATPPTPLNARPKRSEFMGGASVLVSDQYGIIGGGSEAYLIQRAVGRGQDPKIRFRDPASYVARETGRAAPAKPPAAGKGTV